MVVVTKDTGASWFYLAVVSIVTFFTIGFLDSYGVLMVFLVRHYNESNGKAAWVGSLTFFCTFFLYPITLAMRYRFGTRVMLLFAAVLIVPTFMLSPLAPTMNLLFITFSIPFGVTCSIVECTAFTTIRDYFKTYQGVAFGVRIGISTLGTMMYAFLLPVLMADIGWTWTFRTLTGMSLICLFYACVYKALKSDAWKRVQSNVDSTGIQQVKLVQDDHDYCAYYKHLKDKRFLIFLFANTAFYSVALMPPIFMVRFATNIGNPISKAKWLIVARTITSAVTRFALGRFGDLAFKYKKVRHIVVVNMIMYSLSTVLCSFTTSFPLLMLYMVFVSIVDSIHWIIQPLFVTEITRSVHSDKGFALINCFGSFAMLGGPPTLGLLYDKTGEFNAVLYTTSAVLAIAACLMALGVSFSSSHEPWAHLGEGTTDSRDISCSNMQRPIIFHGDTRTEFYQEQYITTV